MSWAHHIIKQLKEGLTVEVRPRGNSMKGKIESGNLVTIEPVKEITEVEKDDIVLATVKGRDYLHLVKAIDGERYQIGNNRGHINGWVKKSAIHGKVIKIET
jgi:hypothetical protein